MAFIKKGGCFLILGIANVTFGAIGGGAALRAGGFCGEMLLCRWKRDALSVSRGDEEIVSGAEVFAVGGIQPVQPVRITRRP